VRRISPAFDFFCAQFEQGQKTIRFARLSGKAVIFTALKSLRRSAANARNHWHDSLRNTDENHTRFNLLDAALVGESWDPTNHPGIFEATCEWVERGALP
jgi:hypothetical protein